MTEDPYEDFAERYDLFYERSGTSDPALASFFRELFARHNVLRVLDCACGTGRHLPLFHALGCDVVGSDLSARMLAQAQVKLVGLGLCIPLHQVDYRCLREQFCQEFDAVVCLSSSILHMPSEEEAVRALSSMRRVIRDGGLLVLTQGTTDKQWREKPRFILAVNNHDFSRLFVIDYYAQGARYNILDIYHSDDADQLKVWSVDYPLVFLRDDQERLLRMVGFESVAFYGGYGFEPYDPATSSQLIAVAGK